VRAQGRRATPKEAEPAVTNLKIQIGFGLKHGAEKMRVDWNQKPTQKVDNS
jgi:hypothetical protein